MKKIKKNNDETKKVIEADIDNVIEKEPDTEKNKNNGITDDQFFDDFFGDE